MELAQLSIRRPVLAVMMSLGLVLAGLIALQDLPVREVPDIDAPVVTVSTIYQGANARVIETEVTERVEEAVNGIEGIKRLTSESREQLSQVTVEFELSRNIEVATQDVRDRVARIRGQLPDEIEEPVVAKQESEARPILWLAVYSERYTTQELTDIAENVLKDPLQTLNGVSSIILGGSKRFAIRIRLDSKKMSARGVTVLDVERALREQNVELPSGTIENLERELSIQTLGEMKTPEEFKRLVIRKEGSKFVRLEDVGRVEVGVEDEKALARYNSKPAMGLGIVKQSKANTVAVANAIKTEVEKLRPNLPEGVSTFVAYDESLFIDAAIWEVWRTLAIAFIFVVITIYVFLKNARSTLVPSLTIPVAIIATFSLLAYFGYSVNILTMLGLVLAIGLVVDDSIVVLENIYRHIEQGESPLEAAKNAMSEISFAVIATTVALVAVFLPLAFQKTITGRLFTEFAVTLCGAVVLSTFVALTLTPSIAARVLKPIREDEKERQGFIERWSRAYRKKLEWCFEHRKLVISLSVVSILFSAFFYVRLDKEFLPDEDKGRLFSLAIAPEGATAEYTDRMVRQMEEIISEQEEVAGYFSAVALPLQAVGQANQGLMFVRFKEDRSRSLQDILAGPRGVQARFFTEVEGSISLAILPKSVGRGFSQSFQLILKDNDLDRLDAVSKAVVEKLQAAGFLTGVRPRFSFSKPELRVRINRSRANALGVSVREISRSMQILFGGRDLSSIKKDGEEYDVIVQLDRQSRLTATDLDEVYVRSDTGTLVQLSNVVDYAISAGPNAIFHDSRGRSATIEATPVEGVSLGSAIEQTQEILFEELPPNTSFAWSGEASDLQDSGADTTAVILLALIVIYMVLAAQFESFVHPLTVMVALPLAAFGAFGLLLLLAQINILGSGMYAWSNYAPDPPAIASVLSAIVPRIPSMTINIYSQLGFVLLLGLVTKNSILLVEFANQQMAKGLSAREAMLEAAVIRFRPILMTAIGTITGILPIAIGFGAGAEGRRPMGVAVIGGMLSATIFTFFVVPVVYTLFDEWFSKHKKEERQELYRKTASLVILLALVSLFPFSLHAQEQEELSMPRVDKQEAQALELSLNRALVIALEHNAAIRKAKQDIAASREVVIEVRSFMLPRISAIANYNETDAGLIESFNDRAFSSERNWASRIELRQPLFSAGKSSAGYSQQKYLMSAAEHEFREVVLETLLQVRQRFFAILLARSQLDVRTESVSLLSEELQNERNKLAAGTVSQFNVLRAEVELANAQTPLIRAKNSVELAKQELVRILGISAREIDESVSGYEVVGELEVDSYSTTLEALLKKSRNVRPKLRRLEALVNAASKGISVQWADFFPKLDAYGSWNYEKSRFSEDLDDTIDGWRAGVELRWDIFSSFETMSKVEQAKIGKRSADIMLSQAKLDVEVEVKRAFYSLLEARELLLASKKVVARAEESLRLARNRFAAGVGTQLEVLDSQVALTQARSNRVQALYDYNITRASLDRVVGIEPIIGSTENVADK